MTRRESLILYLFSCLGGAAVAIVYLRTLTDGAPPLDDTYIHLQYARLLADGYPFHYVAGEGYTTGATSPAYVALLALLFKVGLGGTTATYVIGAISLALAAAGAGVAASRLAGGLRPALGAAGLVLASGYFACNALSGMETGIYAAVLVCAFAWTLEPRPWLPAILALLPLLRPDGIVFTVIFAGYAAFRTRRYVVYAATVLPFALYLVANKLLTGDFASAGLRCKGFTGDVYIPTFMAVGKIFSEAIRRLPIVFFDTFKPPSLPLFVTPLAIVGLVAPGSRRRFLLGAALVLGYLALNNTKGSIHGWTRYFMPLVPLLAVAAAAGIEGLLRRIPLAAWGAQLAAVVALAALSHPPWLRYFADESRIIRGKQVAVAKVIAAKVPSGETVLTMDVGAVAYLGHRPTFDIVGLTTRKLFAPAYEMLNVPGRIELLGAIPPAERPRWAALYGTSLPPVLAARTHFSAAGFQLYEINYAPIDAANRPDGDGNVVDRLDVADWHHERAHGYRFGPPLPPDQRSAYRVGTTAGAPSVDGCRQVTEESFVLAARAGEDAVLVIRTESVVPALTWNGQPLALAPRSKGVWTELEARVPAAQVQAQNRVEARGPRLYRSYHYFLLQ